LLKTVDLSKRFGGNNLVLDGVSVAFDEASVTAIMGPSGSGKTTLLHCLSGMLRATSGKVFLDGVDITGLGRRRLDALRRTSFGFIFQDYNLIDSLTAQVKDVDGVQTVVAVPALSPRPTPENKDASSNTRSDDDFTVSAVDEAAVAPVIRSHHGLEGLDDGTLIVGGIYHLAEGSKVALTGPARRPPGGARHPRHRRSAVGESDQN